MAPPPITGAIGAQATACPSAPSFYTSLRSAIGEDGAPREARAKGAVGIVVRMTNEQIDLVLAAVRDVLGDGVVGAYLFGSAVLGGLRPHSDLDVMVVSRRRTTRHQKQQLVAHLLAVSRRPRPVELTIVVHGEIRPWRYPPRMDFQYGDWWRSQFERGELEPWPSATNPTWRRSLGWCCWATRRCSALRPRRCSTPFRGATIPRPRARDRRAARNDRLGHGQRRADSGPDLERHRDR